MFKSEVKSSKEWAIFLAVFVLFRMGFFYMFFFFIGKISPMVETGEISENSLLANKYLLHAIMGR